MASVNGGSISNAAEGVSDMRYSKRAFLSAKIFGKESNFC